MQSRAQRVEAIRAHAETLRPVVATIIAAGVTTLTGITNELNAQNIRTVKGGRWVPAQVSTLLLRLGLLQ